ncbi:hypothetical protein [Actinokineospora sp. HUAS TT18]|uniref:hypothetical protein n=1 Tax=Actinokineospora sp. HUAS TT18 TaxID=3447451 RepID=UPI003F528227
MSDHDTTRRYGAGDFVEVVRGFHTGDYGVIVPWPLGTATCPDHVRVALVGSDQERFISVGSLAPWP